MTKFRLNAGRPANSSKSGGPSARPADNGGMLSASEWFAALGKVMDGSADSCAPGVGEAETPDQRGYSWSPNKEPDTPLKCGCSIPWPITVLLGSGGKVSCDKHGWQPRIAKKEIARSERLMKQCPSTPNQPMMDPPPF